MKKLKVGTRVRVKLPSSTHTGAIVDVHPYIPNGYVVRADQQTIFSAFDDRRTLLVYAHEIEEEK